MKSSVVTLILSVVTFSAIAADSAFDCIITSDRNTYKVGEVPRISVSIINKSTKDVVLVSSLDGSARDRRFPKCRFEVLDASGKPVTLQIFGCGNLNPLETKDFVAVQAGQAFYPGATFDPFPVTTAGNYTIRFCYSTSDHIEDYFGSERDGLHHKASPEIQRLFEHVPKLDLKSNELKLKFTPKSK